MVIDTSAVVAILTGEPKAEILIEAIAVDARRLLSTASYVEAAIVLESRFGDAGGREFDMLLLKAGIEIVDVTAEQAELARHAWRTYGKGRHPAGLNFGDCFSYALAKTTGEPLAFTGGDFARTDVLPWRPEET